MRRISEWFWWRNVTPPASNPSSGAYMYGDAGQIKVRQADGTTFALGPPTEIDTVIFDAGGPDSDPNAGDAIIFDAGGVQ